MDDIIRIVMDTREKLGKKDHILSYFSKHGIKVIRQKLFCGDWTLLSNQSVCIDTKQGLAEVYGNLIQEHERFKNECARAKENGIRLIVLVEEKGIRSVADVAGWVNPRAIIYEKMKLAHKKTAKAPPISSKRLMNIMKTMTERYGVEWRFTTKETCGENIIKILTGGQE